MARVAIVLADGFEDQDVQLTLGRVADAGHEAVVVGCRRHTTVTGAHGQLEQPVDATPEQVVINDLDALVVPGGASVDTLLTDDRIVSLCKHMALAGRPVALSGHGTALLAATRALDGRTVTSPDDDRAGVEAAGARWVDEPVVQDGNLVSARGDGHAAPLCDALLGHLG